MALVQPTNLFPSSFRGSGGDVIDASVSNTFSLQLNGSSACVAYSLKIMQNDAASTAVYTANKTSLATPIYPRDHTNTPQRLEIVVPSTSGMVNGYANGYKWSVTLYWDSTNSITSADTFFKAEATPYFTVVDPPTTVTSKSVTMTATYTQADSIPLEWYRWTISDANNNVIADTGEVYSEDIQITVDGLLDGESFTYVVVGQTQDGVTVGGLDDGAGNYSNMGAFDVDYEAPIVQGEASFECDKRTGAITVSFPSILAADGRISAGTPVYLSDTPIVGNTSVRINNLQGIIFDTVNGGSMALPDDVTHIWSGTINQPSGTILLYRFTENVDGTTKQGILQYQQSNDHLVYTYDGETVFDMWLVSSYTQDGYVYSTPWDLSDFWMIVAMHKQDLVLQGWKPDGGISPSLTLFPSETLYPSDDSVWIDLGRYST